MLIDCIRFFTTNNLVNGETNHLTESNPILNRITMDTLTPTNINLLPIHIKIIL
ncbi:unnamed protein product, partial [Rotaria magnacalcarata]